MSCLHATTSEAFVGRVGSGAGGCRGGQGGGGPHGGRGDEAVQLRGEKEDGAGQSGAQQCKGRMLTALSCCINSLFYFFVGGVIFLSKLRTPGTVIPLSTYRYSRTK